MIPRYILALFILPLYFTLYSAETRAVPVLFSWSGETVTKVADFPDDTHFQTSDGHFFDAGVIYKTITVFDAPLWNYDIRWVGYIDANTYLDMDDRSELETYAENASVTLPETASLPFRISYGGKIALLILVLLIVFVIILLRDMESSSSGPRQDKRVYIARNGEIRAIKTGFSLIGFFLSPFLPLLLNKDWRRLGIVFMWYIFLRGVGAVHEGIGLGLGFILWFVFAVEYYKWHEEDMRRAGWTDATIEEIAKATGVRGAEFLDGTRETPR